MYALVSFKKSKKPYRLRCNDTADTRQDTASIVQQDER